MKNSRSIFFGSVLFILVLVLFPGPTFPAQELNRILSGEKNIGRFLPGDQTDSGLIVTPYRNQTFKFTSYSRLNPESGETEYGLTCPAYEFKARLDKGLMVIESEIKYLDKDLIRKLGHDRRTARIDPKAGESIIIDYFKKGQKIEGKTEDYKFFTMNLDLIQITLQALTIKGVREFKCPAILPSKGWRAGVVFTRRESGDLTGLAPEYDYPDELTNLIGPDKKYYVWVMKLSGVLGMVYKDKYYCVFQKERPHRFVAYFGGDPKWVEFIFCPDRF